jgi:hypothetical protein
MLEKSNRIVKFACYACIFICIGDFLVMFFLGTYFPGYSQLKNTISRLGASVSPVSNIMSAWWMVVGLFFVFFGIGFNQAFNLKGKQATIASWLIIIYVIGEGIGSGAFKADHIGDSLTRTAIIHDTLGGFGVAAILLLPLVMRRIIPKNELRWFNRMSLLVFFVGIMLLLSFTFRYSSNRDSFLYTYQGLWQRLTMLNNYVYLSTIALIILKKEHHT